jgi:hypothetical protein
MSNERFCAFQPKRAIVPSLPLRLGFPTGISRLGRPPMPVVFCAALAPAFAIRAASAIASISPPPNTGVGMRRLTLLRPRW